MNNNFQKDFDLLSKIDLFTGQKKKVAKLLVKKECRENLNTLIIVYWKTYDLWDGDTSRAVHLTPATSIIRTRSLVVQEIKELDWSESKAKALSNRGKGKKPEAPFEEKNLF